MKRMKTTGEKIFTVTYMDAMCECSHQNKKQLIQDQESSKNNIFLNHQILNCTL